MKELIKVVAKKLFIYSIIFNTLYSIADYGEAFALSYFGKSPLILDKLIKLAICIAITHLVMLVTGKVASYIDNINNQKTQVKIQKYYFNKLQSMTMEQISNTHTGYIHKLIINLSFYFFEMIWQFEISVIPLIIGGTSILIIVCKQSVLTGIICIFISAIAVYLKYKMIKNKQKYQKKVNEAESKYNATFVDFIQNIIAVRKLNISKFCNDKIMENSEEYLKVTKLNERKRSNANGVFTGLMDSLYLIVIVSTIIMVSNGESGQGKTTMNILSGLYPLENGELLVDNQLKNDCRMDLVFVSQEVELFDLSIRDNLCLEKDIPDEKIMQLLDEAGLMGWYKELPNGLETLVGEKGIKLSAGQKQRLNLIRGILIDKELYFFDEPTSNLDALSEEKITNMIEKYLKDKTYVIVTHRPRIKALCNKHYKFEQHMMKEIIDV